MSGVSLSPLSLNLKEDDDSSSARPLLISHVGLDNRYFTT